jgi:hypothetical protein
MGARPNCPHEGNSSDFFSATLQMQISLTVLCLQNYIARFGHGSAKLARQAQSKEKTLAKMVAGGLTERVLSDKSASFYFYSCGTIPPPVIMVQVSNLAF